MARAAGAAGRGPHLRRRAGSRSSTASCASCHAIRGTSADGDVGPDLTHFASRTTLGALTFPNDRGELRAWIRDSQHVKPGNKMPDFRAPGAQLDALVAYLESLK